MKTRKLPIAVGRRNLTSVTRVYSDTCKKLAYASRKEAAGAAAKQRKLSGQEIVFYRCTRGCHAFHLGHPPGTKPKRPDLPDAS